MKLIYILFILINLQAFTNGQEIEPKLKRHCIFIGKAELSIIDEDYKQAISYYNSALNLKPLYDISWMNLILCHIKVGEIDSAASRAIELCERGFPVHVFSRKKFNDLNSSSKWVEYKNMNINRIVYKENNRISRLLEIDQYIRQNKLDPDTIRKIQFALIDSTIQIIDEVGFNTRPIEGYKVYQDTLIDNDDFVILVVHALQIKGDEFKNLIMDCLLEGSISPYEIAFYIRYFYRKTNTIYIGCQNVLDAVFFQIENIIYTCDDELKERSDNIRANLGLLPLDDVIRLSEYYYEKSKEFKFQNLVNMYTIVKGSPNIEEDHKSGLKNGRIYKILETDVDYFK